MSRIELERALREATAAAQAAGQLMRRSWRTPKVIASATQHDIKLELDVRCQKLIERQLRRVLPAAAVLGEEGVAGDPQAALRWVIDPIDGTVNFTYGIPHACVSIALQARVETPARKARTTDGKRRDAGSPGGASSPAYESVVGVVYDPFCDELWTAVRGGQARLNGRPTHVSERRRLGEAIVSLGFGKQVGVLEAMLPAFRELVHRVRKLRMMGAAALGLAYVASGRFDAYVETGLRLWDIAAGGLIVECAGGRFWRRQLPGDEVYELLASNGPMDRPMRRCLAPPPPDLKRG